MVNNDHAENREHHRRSGSEIPDGIGRPLSTIKTYPAYVVRNEDRNANTVGYTECIEKRRTRVD